MGNRKAGLEICARFMRNLVGANKCNFSGVYIVIKMGVKAKPDLEKKNIYVKS